MPAQKRKSIYDQSVRITHAYLGPAAGRFVDRQVRNHLNKEPEDMTAKDLKHLIEWIRIAVSFLTSDAQVVEEYIGQLQQLVKGARL
jgi:hypothetical protein